MDERTNKPASESSDRRRRVKRVRREMTRFRKIEKKFESLFGGRSLGNVAAAILLALAIGFGLIATLQELM